MENKMEPGGQVVDVLIVAQPSRFRDGLKAIVKALAWVNVVGTVDDFKVVPQYIKWHKPALVVFDVNDISPLSWVEVEMLRGACQKTKCIAIIDRAQQRNLAQAMGVDATLLRGFTTDLLYNTMRTLIVAYDPAVPVTGPLGHLRP